MVVVTTRMTITLPPITHILSHPLSHSPTTPSPDNPPLLSLIYYYITISGDLDGGGDDDDDDHSTLHDHRPPTAPIEACCGVIVHLFLSSPQDLPIGAHDSVMPSSSSSSSSFSSSSSAAGAGGGDLPLLGVLSPQWMRDKGQALAARSLSVHVRPPPWLIISTPLPDLPPSHIYPSLICTSSSSSVYLPSTSLFLSTRYGPYAVLKVNP